MVCSSACAPQGAVCRVRSGSVRNLRASRIAVGNCTSDCIVRCYRSSKPSNRRPQAVVCGGSDLPPVVFGQASSPFHAGVSKERVLAPPAAYASVNQDSYGFGHLQGGAPASTCPRFLWWCRNAEDESRLLNYTVNGIVVFAAGFAALSEVGSYHAAFVNAYHLRGILDPFHPMWQAFAKFVEANPVVTQACISGVVYGLGDITAQTYEGRALEDLDAARALRSALCGFIAYGPLCHFYYSYLDHWMLSDPAFKDVPEWALVGMKMVVDQTAWSVFWNALYYLFLGVLNLESPAVIVGTVKMSWWNSLRAGWRLWPFAHLVTYSLPREYRVLWVGMVELLWATVLSLYGQQRRQRVAAQMEAAGAEAVGQVACVLPGAPGEGGYFTEEILRGIEHEGEVVLVSGTGQATTIFAVDALSGTGGQEERAPLPATAGQS